MGLPRGFDPNTQRTMSERSTMELHIKTEGTTSEVGGGGGEAEGGLEDY